MLLHDCRPPSIDRRVKRVLRDLPSRLEEAEAVSLEMLAASVGAGELAGGKAVADAADAAGFSDAAHFTRTFRRMIGATPGQVLQRGFAARDFVNYMQADEPIERVRATFGSAAFARLQALKSRYDPNNVLHCNQNVPPPANAASAGAH
jgi:Berberine and berberine like/Helix-turn-helix domain